MKIVIFNLKYNLIEYFWSLLQ